MDTGYFVPVLSPRLKSRGPRRRMSRLGVRVGERERERERERGQGRVGNRQPGKAKLPLGAARFVSSACVVWAGGRTDVLIAFCIVGRAKSAAHARSPGGCLPVCLRACESLGLRRSGRGRARAASLQHDAVRLGPRGTGQRI